MSGVIPWEEPEKLNSSQCNSCKFQHECRFKEENINNTCKFFISTLKQQNR